MANNKVIKIDIQKVTQDFEIGSKTYTMDFSDDKVKMYGEYINNITAAVDEVRDKKEENPLLDIAGNFKDVESQLRGFIDLAFGIEAYDEIFNEVGRSSIVMSDVLVQVVERAQEEMELFKMQERQEKKAEYYTKKNKQ